MIKCNYNKEREESTMGDLTTTFTKQEEQKFNRFVNRIVSAYNATNKSMLDIAGSIAAIASANLYKVECYKNVYDFCKEKFNISRGTVSNCINVWKEYGDSKTGELLPEYKNYTFTQLVEIRKLPEEKQKAITAETSVRDIKKQVKEEKAEGKQSKEEKREVQKVAIKIEDTKEKAEELVQMIYSALEAGRDILFTTA